MLFVATEILSPTQAAERDILIFERKIIRSTFGPVGELGISKANAELYRVFWEAGAVLATKLDACSGLHMCSEGETGISGS